MNSPSISVILAVYNREKYVGRAVDSVLSQSFDDYELIVVDDGSTDRTPEILKNYGDRICVIRRDRNSGLPSAARNTGMAQAQGRYMAFLDSDDFWYPKKLAAQTAFMRAHEHVVLSHTFCHVVDETGSVQCIRREEEMPRNGDLFVELLNECFITTSTVMICRSLYERIGGFNEDPALKRGEDREFFLRAMEQGEVGFVPEVLAAHRKGPDNVSGEGFAFQKSILHTQQWIIDHPALWVKRVSKNAPVDAFVRACKHFSFYWQARHDYRKALYFDGRALWKAPFCALNAVRVLKTMTKALRKT